MRELWHAAGRAAADSLKRRTALLGVLASVPVLLLGAVLSGLLSGCGLPEVTRPLHAVLAPLDAAWRAGDDLGLLGYLALQGLLLTLLWGWFGGALVRQAAVHLTQGRRESPRAALGFARRHWRGLVGAKVALPVGAGLPLAGAVLLALLGRVPGTAGGLLLAVAVLAGAGLAFVGVFLLLGAAVGCFLTSPTIACEDSDAIDAVSRSFAYASAGVPRLTLWRLVFLGGVLLGSAWRAVRLLLVVGVGALCLRLGAGAEAVDRVERILKAGGSPTGAERLHLGWGHHVAALAVALALGALFVLWLADLLTRVACARTAVYLALRERVDRVPRDRLASPPVVPTFQDASAAGFEEIGRVGAD
jgi:hypothetical protein